MTSEGQSQVKAASVGALMTLAALLIPILIIALPPRPNQPAASTGPCLGFNCKCADKPAPPAPANPWPKTLPVVCPYCRNLMTVYPGIGKVVGEKIGATK